MSDMPVIPTKMVMKIDVQIGDVIFVESEIYEFRFF